MLVSEYKVTVRSLRGDNVATRSILISSEMSVFDLIVIMDEGKGLNEFVSWHEKSPNDVVDLLSRFSKEVNKHFDFGVELPPKTDEARNFHESTWTSSVIHCQIPLWFKTLFGMTLNLRYKLMLDDECEALLTSYWFRTNIS